MSLVHFVQHNPTSTNAGSKTDVPSERPSSESWHGLTSDSIRAVKMV